MIERSDELIAEPSSGEASMDSGKQPSMGVLRNDVVFSRMSLFG